MNSLQVTTRAFFCAPIFNSLLLSLSLHLALLGLVQATPGGGGMETVVISARLDLRTLPLPETPPEATIEPVVESVSEKPGEAVATPPAAAPALLTSNVPSPAPPLPVAPIPAEAKPSEEKPAAAVAKPVTAAPPASPAVSAPGPAAQTASAPLGIGIDTTWYDARQVDVHAHAVAPIVPLYPDEARRRNQEGTLKLLLKIDDLGRVRDAEVLEADLPGVFDEVALEAFKNARFHPAMKNGRPVRYQAYIRVVFKLRD